MNRVWVTRYIVSSYENVREYFHPRNQRSRLYRYLRSSCHRNISRFFFLSPSVTVHWTIARGSFFFAVLPAFLRLGL